MALCAVLSAGTGCSVTDVGGGGEGGNGGDGSGSGNWILGNWSGTYLNEKADAGTSLRETSAKARFVETADNAGTFRIDLPLLTNVSVEGTYRDFQGKSLMLKITKSTLSPVGKEGGTTTMDYELIGDDLEVRNDRIVLRLQREKDGEGSGGGTGDDKPKSPLIGRYDCVGNSARAWTLTVKTDTTFRMDIRESGRTPLWYDGTLSPTPNDQTSDATLVVTDSNADADIGMQFGFKRYTGGTATLLRMVKQPDGSLGLAEQLQCEQVSD